MKVNILTTNFSTKIFINGKLHVSFKSKHYRGVQNYIGAIKGCYVVEWRLKDTKIKCEYDNFRKWEVMLRVIEEWLQ